MAEDHAALIKEITERFGKDRTRLMDIVRAVRQKLGHLSEETIGQIAEALGIHRVEVRDMVSFYAFLPREPRGTYVIRLSNSVVERMKGMEAVAKAFEQEAGIRFGETTPDGLISLEYAACIGMSDQAPAALINGIVFTNLTPEHAKKIIQSIRSGDESARVHGGKPSLSDVALNLRQTGPVIFAPMEAGAGIRKAVGMTPGEVIAEVNTSRLRGRGGAGFPTAMKWDFCRKAEGEHYIICNADEGEPGTFKDRVILTQCPDLVFEGMTVAAYATGASQGFLYLRGEYEYLLEHLEQVLARRRRAGLLGENICGRQGFNFDIRIQVGAGAYICGEESALIESLEGKRGAPRDRPPFPVQKGYLKQPTVVNNVETLCAAARIAEKGGAWFAQIGTRDSTGTKLISVSGDCERPGVYEIEYGMTITKILDMVGGSHAQAVQVAGPSGQCLAPKDFGRSISFEDLPTGGSFIVFGPERDILEHMRQFTEFFVEESCGWCVPCRAGTVTLLKLLDKILAGRGGRKDLVMLEELANTIKTMSRCGLGQTAANPVLSTLKNFPELYEEKLQPEDYVPRFNMAEAVAATCAFTGQQCHLEE